MEFRVLGPLEVVDDTRPREVRPGKQRLLLATLLCVANTPVPADQLIDILWGDRPPRTAAENLRGYVYHLRRALGSADRLPRSASGYALTVRPGELDAERFESLASAGHDAVVAGRIGPAGDLIGQALRLWRGRPYLDLDDVPLLRAESRRLEERRQAVLELRIDADLMRGKHLELIAELDGLTRQHPAQERFHAQYMLALYRARRQDEALEVFGRLRARLAGELGLDPSPRVRELHAAILRADPTLDDRRPGWLPETTEDAGEVGLGTVCPYPGLTPFDVADAQLYFGRERLVAEGIARLATHRTLAVVGPSGSGKSSLARAGLLAELAAAGHGADPVIIRPGQHPSISLRTALAGRTGGFTLLVDQCEETFTECGDERERAEFLDAIAGLAADREHGPLVIVVLRADFYGHCTAHPAFAQALARSQILVGQMGEAELRRAIERPARLAGLRLVDGLADALVTDVAGQPGALPLLATTLRELWNRRGNEVLTLEAYVASGGIHQAVAVFAERAYAELSAGQHDTARRILLRLAAPGDGATMVRRRVTRAELADLADDQAEKVVQLLATHRLLSVADGAVEIAHEAVLEQWPRLRAWLTEDIAGLRLHRALTTATQVWLAGGRDPEDLLRGIRLAATLDWAATRTDELTTAEAKFLAESAAVADATAKRAQDRIAAQSRANRRLRWLTSALIVALLAAIGASGLAVGQRRQADDRTREARSRELAARAGVESDLDRALLLAVAGERLDDSPTTQGALLSALIRTEWVTAIDVLSEPAVGMALTPDGRSIVISGSGSVFRLDLTTRTVTQLDQLPGNSLSSPAVSPDGRTVAVGATNRGDTRVVFWDLITGRRTGERSIPETRRPSKLAWRADGQAVAVTGQDAIRIIELAGDVTTIPFPALGGLYSSDLEYLTDGLLASNDQKTVFYNDKTGVELLHLDVGGPLGPAPDGTRVMLGGGGSKGPAVLDLEQRRITAQVAPLNEPLSQAVWAGTDLVGTGLNNTIYLWPPDMSEAPLIHHGHTGNITGAAVSPNGQTLYTAALDQRLIAWDLSRDRGLWQLASIGQQITDKSAFASDGRLVAVSNPTGTVSLLDTATEAPIGNLAAGTQVTAMTFSPDRAKLAVADADGRIGLWDLPGLHPTGTKLAGQDVQLLQFSPNGRLLLQGGSTSGARLWTMPGNQAPVDLPGPRRLSAIAFAADDRIVVGGTDGHIMLTTPEGRELWTTTISGSPTMITAANNHLLIGDSRGMLHGWNLLDGRELWPPRRTGGPVTALTVDRTGTQVAVSGGGDSSVDLWDIADGIHIATLTQPGDVVDIAFAPRSNRLVALGSSGVITRWDLDTEAWLRRACAITNRELTANEWSELAIPQPADPLCT